MAEGCTICRLPEGKRADLEAALTVALAAPDVDAALVDVASDHSVARRTLQRHQAHRVPTAPVPSPPTPRKRLPDSHPVQSAPPYEGAGNAVAEVQQLLDQGRPLAEVYGVASRHLAGFLSAGLSLDCQRAWVVLLRTLRDASAEKGRIPAIQEHPDWGAVIDVILDGVSELPGGPAAVLEAVRRATLGVAKGAT
jgi:hypothetical protein